MNHSIISMTPNIELEQQLLASGSFRFCDNQSECGPNSTNPLRPVGVFWRHNDTPDNIVPVGWHHTPGMASFTECPFCVRSTIEILGEEEYNEIPHDQIEVAGMFVGTSGTGTTGDVQITPSTSPPSLKKSSKTKSKSKSLDTPSDKNLLSHAKKMGMPASAIKAIKEKLKQNKRDKLSKRFFKFSPASYTPPSKSKPKSKSKNTTKKRKRSPSSKSKSKTKKVRK